MMFGRLADHCRNAQRTSDDESLVWGHLALESTVDGLVGEHRRPPSSRTDLVSIMGHRAHPGSRVLEAGCFTGLTSALMAETHQCTLLDLSPQAIEIATQVFDRLELKADFVVGDLFKMPFGDGAFDVVFNSGVLEHFETSQRGAALREMSRVTTPGGLVCVAVPNHHSVPYRLAYLIRRATGHWRYPPERKIKSLACELTSLGLVRVEVQVVASDLRFSQLAALPFAVGICKAIERAKGEAFGGYLEVASGVKQGAAG
ncbi:MAG: class I SAM-dependent methyltransferase [Armatimonadetes bacterium]|nr:class I SAM-dependent methyltransferase [Armatimonadota bacterium]